MTESLKTLEEKILRQWAEMTEEEADKAIEELMMDKWEEER